MARITGWLLRYLPQYEPAVGFTESCGEVVWLRSKGQCAPLESRREREVSKVKAREVWMGWTPRGFRSGVRDGWYDGRVS